MTLLHDENAITKRWNLESVRTYRTFYACGEERQLQQLVKMDLWSSEFMFLIEGISSCYATGNDVTTGSPTQKTVHFKIN